MTLFSFFFIFFALSLCGFIAWAIARRQVGDIGFGISYCALSLIAFVIIYPQHKYYFQNPEEFHPSSILVKDASFIEQKPDKLLITADTNKQYVVDNKEYIQKNQFCVLPPEKTYEPVVSYLILMLTLIMALLIFILFLQ